MVDRSRRSLAAQVLRDFMAGRLTNFDFEEKFPQSGSDRVLAAIAEMVWFTYDDLKTHQLEGEYTLTDVGREVLERCLLFLGTGLEYSGPRGFVAPDIPRDDMPGSLERLLHRLLRRELPTVQSVWNATTWPFKNQEQLDSAMNDA
jgi:hypothetical protein